MKYIIIGMALIGFVLYVLIVSSATPSDAEEYRRYEEWKERQRDD